MAIRTFLIYSLFLATCGALPAQDIVNKYQVGGVDSGQAYEIVLKSDLARETLSCSVGGQETRLYGVQDIVDITLQEKCFLAIKLRERGGSGVKVRRSVLLCVSSGKVHVALDITSDVISKVSEVYDKVADSLKLFDEKEDYHVRISVDRKQDGQYRALLEESLTVVSKYDPADNVSRKKSIMLKFEPAMSIFYNVIKPINKKFDVYSNRDYKTTARHIQEDLHGVQLDNGEYFFLDEEWYRWGEQRIIRP